MPRASLAFYFFAHSHWAESVNSEPSAARVHYGEATIQSGKRAHRVQSAMSEGEAMFRARQAIA